MMLARNVTITLDERDLLMLSLLRKFRASIILLTLLTLCGTAGARPNDGNDPVKRIAILWADTQPQGKIAVSDGEVRLVKRIRGRGDVAGAEFNASENGTFGLEVTIQGSQKRYGAKRSIVTVATKRHPFSFFLSDVDSRFPIYIPRYDVIVSEAGDSRTFAEIVEDIKGRGLKSPLQRIEEQSEETYESAADKTRSPTSAPAWLGISRDIRIFEVGRPTVEARPRGEWVEQDYILPKFHWVFVTPQGLKGPVRYDFVMGRGIGPVDASKRWIEDGALPIYHRSLVDGGVHYEQTTFVSLERTALRAENLRGTHYVVADGHSARGSYRFTEEQQRKYEEQLPVEMARAEETVAYIRITATNRSAAPRYAWIKSIYPTPTANRNELPISNSDLLWQFNGSTGMGTYESSGLVFSVSRLNGQVLGHQEVAILLAPGESADLDMWVPHSPITPQRAEKLADQAFEKRLEEVREFWRAKLRTAARIEVPEPLINERVQAGLIHLDLITYGLEPSGELTPSVGRYSAIGTESVPIVNFFDTMGWHDVARRSAMSFLDRQQEDGQIRNFDGYTVETGAALRILGEHYRYRPDSDWVRKIEPKLIKATNYLLEWIERNKDESLRGAGYGMVDGAVGDPDDPYRYYFNSGYVYRGLYDVAEMLSSVNPSASFRLSNAAAELKENVRASFFQGRINAPVIPAGDGTWIPSFGPLADYRGPLILYADGGSWYTHGSSTVRDGAVGPAWLIFAGILDPDEPVVDFLLSAHNLLLTERNVTFSQPMYSRHPLLHLLRGETKPFLKTFYNALSSLADRETHTFWEIFSGHSPHKTAEEAWFLMQVRWMLCLEHDGRLRLLSGIPRSYLENGKRISVEGLATHFGNVSFDINSRLANNAIEARVVLSAGRLPQEVEIRLPHPTGKTAVSAEGGTYDPARETVTVEAKPGETLVTLYFD